MKENVIAKNFDPHEGVNLVRSTKKQSKAEHRLDTLRVIIRDTKSPQIF